MAAAAAITAAASRAQPQNARMASTASSATAAAARVFPVRMRAAVAVQDLADYERVLLDQILAIPAVTQARTTFAIRTVLSRGPVPLTHWR